MNRFTELEVAGNWPYDWRPATLLMTRVGSHSHGTYVPPEDPLSIDDTDIMWIVQPPRRLVYGLQEWQHWTPVAGTYGDLDVVAYSVRKLARLLLKGNPNAMGLLWISKAHILVEHAEWEKWRQHRTDFLSERVYDSFVNYAADQLRRLTHPNHMGRLGRERKEQFEQFGYSPKNAAHCLRLLRMGLELAETGEMNVDRTGIDAEEIIAVKHGEWPLDKIQREADEGVQRLEAAREANPLPAEPNTLQIERLLMGTTEALWDEA